MLLVLRPFLSRIRCSQKQKEVIANNLLSKQGKARQKQAFTDINRVNALLWCCLNRLLEIALLFVMYLVNYELQTKYFFLFAPTRHN